MKYRSTITRLRQVERKNRRRCRGNLWRIRAQYTDRALKTLAE